MSLSAIHVSSYTPPAAQDNSSIDKQISALQKEIQKTRADKSIDDKTKDKKIAQLQKQIAELEKMKAQQKQQQASPQVQAADKKGAGTGRFESGQYLNDLA